MDSESKSLEERVEGLQNEVRYLSRLVFVLTSASLKHSFAVAGALLEKEPSLRVDFGRRLQDEEVIALASSFASTELRKMEPHADDWGGEAPSAQAGLADEFLAQWQAYLEGADKTEGSR